ncbi:uncharacterized protein OCT59_024268 [Rhizophagus irregularis]|uniref:uncharacterized protein n=1 Tax=Rhizophagus irregularis TaxID=588596 RepID=UPI00331C8DB1|nr:hypothetical protein OCT59_024268 [Rhizophagus irregularis]
MCTDRIFFETWSLQIKNLNIGVNFTPARLTQRQKEMSSQFRATIMGFNENINIQEMHGLLLDMDGVTDLI